MKIARQFADRWVSAARRAAVARGALSLAIVGVIELGPGCSSDGGPSREPIGAAGIGGAAGAGSQGEDGSDNGGGGAGGNLGLGGSGAGGAGGSGTSEDASIQPEGGAGANATADGGTSDGTTNRGDSGAVIATTGTTPPLMPALGLAGPALKIDLDMQGRPTSEVTELGYTTWPITSGATAIDTFQGVTFTFSAAAGGTLVNSNWQKAAVDAPNYARLVGDGIIVDGATGAAQIQLTIRGLAAGKHSLLSWHNYANPQGTAATVDVLVDGVVQVSRLAQSVAALTDADAPTSYVTFTATAGRDVVILYRSTGNLMVNAFELDTPNLAAQATLPVPTDGDEHVNADTGSFTLSWKASKTGVSHDVYFGEDPLAVQRATHTSPLFARNQAGTTYGVSGLRSIKRYYWRIDEIDAQGVVTNGNLWYFRPRQVAFPGAEGYGRFAIGGRGGVVVHVTNLNDSGAGSLRDAIETDRGPRTVVFDVGGIIPLASRLSMAQNYITVAGQTAPGKGICVRAAPFGLTGNHDVVIRDLRVRLGAGITYDGMGMAGADHSIIDHCSISWTIDEAFSSRNGKNITLQRTFISEALNDAGHMNYPPGTQHGYAASIGGDIGSFHHNLLAHCEGRNWSLAGGLDPTGNFAGRLDIFNNVVYNWKSRTTDGGAHQVNFVGNYYKPGAASTIFTILNAQYDNFPGTQQYYFAGNVEPGHFDESTEDSGRVAVAPGPNGYSAFVTQSWFPSYATVQTAGEAYKSVLSDVGETSPVLDDHDVRVVKETLNGTFTYKGSLTGLPGLPDSEADVGGFENYPNDVRAANWDTDGDGLPDWWEANFGLNPKSAKGDYSDANIDTNGDGYTQLEEYLSWMAEPHYFTSVGKNVAINLGAAFTGYTNGPTYKVANVMNGPVTIAGTTATFAPAHCGMSSWSLTVTDQDGGSMTKNMVAFVDNGSGTCP